jgi:predicted Holliday junction resolvase-like endonuclease
VSLKKQANEIIQSLTKGHFYAECPCCREQISLDEAGLFYLNDFTPEAKDLYQVKLDECKERDKELKALRKAMGQSSKVGAKAVNIGKMLERVAPCMSAFPFDRNDCRSLFDPIDYLVFEGLSDGGSVSRIVFTDIKTGNARLIAKQKRIRDLVEGRKVFWETYQRK